MGNHAQHIRETDGLGKPVLRRGRNFIEFDMGGGVTRHVATIDPLHIRSSGTEIDASFVPDTGAWQWKLAQADFQVHTRDVFNSGNIVEWRHSTGEWIIVDPQSINWVNQDYSRQQIAIKQAVSPTVNDFLMRWNAAYGAGRHFEFLAHPKRLIKHFIIDSAANLPAPTVTGTIHFEAEFTLSTSAGVDFWLDGVRWLKTNGQRVKTANRIEFRNTANTEVLWYADAPTATDANGNTVVCEYEVRRQGGPSNLFITVRVPKTWIDTATFPIYIDPTFTDGYGGDIQTYIDTYVSEAAANTNYATITEMRCEFYTGENMRSLIKFNISSLSGATINSATLSLWTDNAVDLHAMVMNQILAANSGWTEADATWNYAVASTTRWAGDAASNGGTDAGCGVSGTDYSATQLGAFTVPDSTAAGTQFDSSLTTTEVDDWLTANYGFVLRCTTNTGSAIRFRTSDHATTGTRPKLVVDYTAGASGGPSLVPSLPLKYIMPSLVR